MINWYPDTIIPTDNREEQQMSDDTAPTMEEIKQELDAMQTAHEALVILDQDARERAVRWLDAKLRTSISC